MNSSLQLQPGALHFFPGRSLPSIESTRLKQLARLLVGRPPEAAPQLLPALYTLCAGAHRLAATLACDAALGRRDAPAADELATLRRDTLREHLRRFWLDWPRQLMQQVPEAAALAALGASPALAAAGSTLETAYWVQAQVLGEPARDWLARWERRDDEALRHWAANGATLPARALHAAGERSRDLAREGLPALPSPPTPELLMRLWKALAEDPAFELAPRDAGRPAETGPWTRGPAARPPRHALDRLLSRVAEAVRLATAPGDATLLRAGAWSPAPGCAIAWCEMARGTLFHAVALEGGAGEKRIAQYRVIAPTEWNFHPHGAAARALAALAPDNDPSRDCGLIAAAFDPCVEFEVRPVPPSPAAAQEFSDA